jgi:hypothetical protein
MPHVFWTFIHCFMVGERQLWSYRQEMERSMQVEELLEEEAKVDAQHKVRPPLLRKQRAIGRLCCCHWLPGHCSAQGLDGTDISNERFGAN